MDSKKYYNDIKKLFPIKSKKEKIYLRHIKEQINEYENVPYSDLENQFGTPIEIVKSYYDTVDSQYLIKKISVKKMILVSCFCALLIITFYSGYRIYVLNKAYENFKNSIPTEVEEIIEED